MTPWLTALMERSNRTLVELKEAIDEAKIRIRNCSNRTLVELKAGN